MVEAMRVELLFPEASNRPGRNPGRNHQTNGETREEMDDWITQKVDETFKKYGKPAGKPFDVQKILANDEQAYSEPISNGNEEVGRTNGSIVMRRKAC